MCSGSQAQSVVVLFLSQFTHTHYEREKERCIVGSSRVPTLTPINPSMHEQDPLSSFCPKKTAFLAWGLRRHQPSLPNKNPFVPSPLVSIFFSLAWVTNVSVGLLGCGHPLSLTLSLISSPLAPKLVDHCLYALAQKLVGRGERRQTIVVLDQKHHTRFLVFLRFDKQAHMSWMHPYGFFLWFSYMCTSKLLLYTYTTYIETCLRFSPLSDLLYYSYIYYMCNCVLPSPFENCCIGKNNHTCWLPLPFDRCMYSYETHSYVMSPLRTQWRLHATREQKLATRTLENIWRVS